jgi:peptidoglycan hydrolase-like protein with peptidoglycan-binding domain
MFMADEMVLKAQQWVNATYSGVSGYAKVDETGKTGWSTVYALTRALQHELGIAALSDNFGPGTLSALTSQHPAITDQSDTPANIVKILQSGLYCTGYDGSGISGVFDDTTYNSVLKLLQDMGVLGFYVTVGMYPKVFKALLTMNPYVMLSGGSEQVRVAQQWLNGTFLSHSTYYIVPCDGYFSRDVQKALMMAIQYSLGISDANATGAFGPGTQAGLKSHPVGTGASGVWVQLFSAAMAFNRRPNVVFTDTFNASLAAAVTAFQQFVHLDTTGQGDYQTWASLLVSTGDSTRKGIALDSVTQVTSARASALTAAGYTTVGRYLTNVSVTSLNKKIQPGELEVIRTAGMRVFPIYQTYGGSVDYFNATQGGADALAALEAARSFGFKAGTRIYFSVDFDALDQDITSNVIPHFQAIKTRLDQYGSEYEIGIYGPRNVCSRVGASGATTASFVSDMSTGFSGNLGFPMPEDWAFDQISTISVGSGDGAITIDNNISSGRDLGQNSFNLVTTGEALDVVFNFSNQSALLDDVNAYMSTVDLKGAAAEALRPYKNELSLSMVLSHDPLITGLARSLGIRKSLIQTTLYREIRFYGVSDDGADLLVANTYDYEVKLEEWNNLSPAQQTAFAKPVPPVPSNYDSSTGLGQIFAATAIDARNYCTQQGVIRGSLLNKSNWHDMWSTWQKLRDDDDFSISTVPLVLISGAHDISQRKPDLTYTEDETLAVFTRYNGFGSAAEFYGREQLGMYRVFEKYNAPARNL